MNWRPVKRDNAEARALADRHYSRQTIGAREFMPPGRTFVLLAPGAVWGVCENVFRGRRRLRVTIFRNESEVRSSELVTEATLLTLARFGLNGLVLETEVDASAVRHKRDPGRCFTASKIWRRAGRTSKGLERLVCTLTEARREGSR